MTITIFTYRRIDKLIQCITSINHSSCDEILIFNDDEKCSLKNTVLTTIVEVKKKLKIFDPQDFGFSNRQFRKPIYMNKAIELSNSDKILFSDDDGIFGPDAINIHVKALYDNQFCAGSIKRNSLLKNHISHNILQGTNISFHKKCFLEVGGYDENYANTGGGGDVDFWYRIYKYITNNSLPVAYLPKAYQRVQGNSKRKKCPDKARKYTKEKHQINSSKKMYKWFPDIRNKAKWMQIIE